MTARLSEEPSAVIPHAGICEGGVELSASLSQSTKMKSLIRLFVLIVTVSSNYAFSEDFVKELDRLKKEGDNTVIQAFLNKASETEKDNPDYYVLAANYWWELSHTLSITAKPSENGDHSLRDPKGAEVGSISTLGQVNPEIPKRAVAVLTEGARQFPQRVDIALGLAYILNELEMDQECVATLLKLLEFSSKNTKELRWKGNAQLPSEASKFIPEVIYEYSFGFYEKKTDQSNALCAKLCDATIRSFPDHPYAYNIKAGLAGSQGLQDDVIKFLDIAHRKAPSDPLILLNLGDTYLKSGKTFDAKKAYAKVLEIDTIDDSLKQRARDAINSVEKVGDGKSEKEPERSNSGLQQPRTMLVGGGKYPKEATARFVEWAGGKNAKILVITWGGGADGEKWRFDKFKKELQISGVEDVEMSPTVAEMKGRTSRSRFEDSLARASGVFFTGGDQDKIMDCIAEHELRQLLRKKHSDGIPFGGNSAGAAVMSDQMMSPTKYGDDFKSLNTDWIEFRPGLGMIETGLIDQHFLERRRQNRLFSALIKSDRKWAVGVDEGNAVSFEGDNVEVFGEGYVWFVTKSEKSDSEFVVRLATKDQGKMNIIKQKN